MKLFYGWVIVGAGMVVTCIGMGSMMSLGVYLQPMSQDMGWSRAGISFTAVLSFLAMGFGSFLWGSLSDRFGTRACRTGGRRPAWRRAHLREPCCRTMAVPAFVRNFGGARCGQLLCTVDRDDHPLVHGESQPCCGACLVRHGSWFIADRTTVTVDHHQL